MNITTESASCENRAHRMRDMIHRLDIDRLEFSYDSLGETYAQAWASCVACDCADLCRSWLADAADGEEPAFCPNLPIFERFKKS